MINVGERIRKAREAKGLTQGYIAERLRPPVVQTTIGDIEKRADLKVTRAREIAAILEIDEKLLTDEQSELDAEDVVPVVRRESLRIFMKQASLKTGERRQYERIAAHRLAPTTIAGWCELRDLIQQFLGRSPERQPAPTSGDAPTTAAAMIETQPKKHMARVEVDRLSRSLRRAG
jgi:transcriptional regulator with XRE-family HTH domain